jgi:hypothetical protein
MLTRRLMFLTLCLVFACGTASASVYTDTMLGSFEVPPNASPATGATWVSITGNTMMVTVDWNGLIGGNPSAAHIHCCIAPGNNVGVAVGFPGFPNTLSGTYSHTFDLLDSSIYTSGFLNNFGGGTAAGAEAALIAGLDAGWAYSNIHNSTFPGGEIRGLLAPVPEPSTLLLLAPGISMLGLGWRKKLSSAVRKITT